MRRLATRRSAVGRAVTPFLVILVLASLALAISAAVPGPKAGAAGIAAPHAVEVRAAEAGGVGTGAAGTGTAEARGAGARAAGTGMAGGRATRVHLTRVRAAGAGVGIGAPEVDSSGAHTARPEAPASIKAGPIQIGGEFSLKLDYSTGYPLGMARPSGGGQGSGGGQPPGAVQGSGQGHGPGEGQESWRPGIQQDLRLYLAARTSARSDVFVSLSTGGVWGVQFPSDGSYGMDSTFGPLLIDEANFRYVSENSVITAGRLYAQMGPMGLICSSPLSPFEGAFASMRVGDGTEFSALYSRLSSQYMPNTYMVVGGDELLAFRLASRAGQWILGYNYLYTGLVDERAQSVDFQGVLGGLEIRGELAFARPPTTFEPKFNHGWVPGWALSGDVLRSKAQRLTVTVGSLARGFTPTYSTSASAGGEDLGLYENTRGIKLSYSRDLSQVMNVKASLAGLAFNDPQDAKDKGIYDRIPTRRLDLELSRRLSPSSQLSIGYSSFRNDHSGYGRLRASYSVSF